MLTTKKFKVHPNEKAKIQFNELSELGRCIYNEFLKRRIDSYEATKTTPNFYQQCRELTIFRHENAKFEQLRATSCQAVLGRLEANFRSFFALRKNGRKASIPRFRGKDYFFTLDWFTSGYKINKNRILTLSQGRGYEKIQIQLPRDYGTPLEKIRQVSVKYDGKDFWVMITGDIEANEYQDNEKYIAIDAGVTNIATILSSDGELEVVANNDFLKNDKIADTLRGFVAKKKKGSKRYLRAQEKYRKLRRKTSNQRKNFQHHVAKNIVQHFDANTIFVEDLDVQNMAQTNTHWHKLNRKTQNTGSMTSFLHLLANKAVKIGKKEVAVNARGTSSNCHNCDKTHHLELWERTMICDCGVTVDRDVNACINIMLRGFEKIQLPMSTGYRFKESIRHITRIAA